MVLGWERGWRIWSGSLGGGTRVSSPWSASDCTGDVTVTITRQTTCNSWVWQRGIVTYFREHNPTQGTVWKCLTQGTTSDQQLGNLRETSVWATTKEPLESLTYVFRWKKRPSLQLAPPHHRFLPRLHLCQLLPYARSKTSDGFVEPTEETTRNLLSFKEKRSKKSFYHC